MLRLWNIRISEISKIEKSNHGLWTFSLVAIAVKTVVLLGQGGGGLKALKRR